MHRRPKASQPQSAAKGKPSASADEEESDEEESEEEEESEGESARVPKCLHRLHHPLPTAAYVGSMIALLPNARRGRSSEAQCVFAQKSPRRRRPHQRLYREHQPEQGQEQGQGQGQGQQEGAIAESEPRPHEGPGSRDRGRNRDRRDRSRTPEARRR
jgi:hypothetical protein